jgi:hypothetical protein
MFCKLARSPYSPAILCFALMENAATNLEVELFTAVL